MNESKTELDRIWSQALNVIKKNFVGAEQFFDQFFDPLRLISIEGSTAVIEAGSKMVVSVLSTNDKYREMTIDALKKVTQTDYSVKFVDEGSYKAMTAPAFSAQSYSNQFFAHSRINKDFTFDNFVVGDSNKEAYQAAVLAATDPGFMNPIFIHSQTGYGKTHLLNAIGNSFKEANSARKVLYTNTDEFTDEFVKFARGRTDMSEFKEYFNTVDMLLIDDIQFLAGKEQTSAFFFNIFNNFVSQKKQIVLTSDRAPAELDKLEDRLVSRFSSGLTVMIKKPQPQTMLDILKMKIKGLNIDCTFDPEVLTYLVAHNPGNIRSMEGDLHKLIFTSSVMKNTGEITIDICREAFGDRGGKGGGETDPLSADKIINAVCSFYSVEKAQVLSKVRTLQIALARQISMYLCREMMSMPFNEIGKNFKRDHSTAMSAVRKIKKTLKTDPALARNIDELKKKLNRKVVETSYSK